MIHNRQRYDSDQAYRDSLGPDARALYDLERLDSERYYADIKPTAMVYVTVYARVRRYGGSEEGGWWYDNWYIDSDAPQFRSQNQYDCVAHNQILAMEWCERINASFVPYNSLNVAVDYIPIIETKRGSHVDTARQRYS